MSSSLLTPSLVETPVQLFKVCNQINRDYISNFPKSKGFNHSFHNTLLFTQSPQFHIALLGNERDGIKCQRNRLMTTTAARARSCGDGEGNQITEVHFISEAVEFVPRVWDSVESGYKFCRGPQPPRLGHPHCDQRQSGIYCSTQVQIVR